MAIEVIAPAPEDDIVPIQAAPEQIVLDTEIEQLHQSGQDLSKETEWLFKIINRTRKLKADPLNAKSPFTNNNDMFSTIGGIGEVAGGLMMVAAELSSKMDEHVPLTIGTSLMLPLGASYLTYVIRRDIHTRRIGVTLPEGYALMPVFANEASQDNRVNKGDVVVAIFPRIYPEGEQESAAQSRRRLYDAVKVANNAGADRLIIPDSVLSKSGIGIHGDDRLGDMINGISEREIKLPDSSQSCLLMDAAKAQHMVENMSFDETPWSQILTALKNRYPHNFALKHFDGDPSDLVPNIHRFLLRASEQVLMGAGAKKIWVEGAKTTEKVKVKESLATEIVGSSDQYDPVFRQFAPGDYQNSTDAKLSNLLAHGRTPHQMADDIATRFRDGKKLDDLELLYLALQTIKSDDNFCTIETPNKPETVGDDPHVAKLLNRHEQPGRRKYLRRALGRMMLATVLSIPAAVYLHDIGDYINQQSNAGSSSVETSSDASIQTEALNTGLGYPDLGQNSDEPVWKVVGHGMSADGYYSEMLENKLQDYKGHIFWTRELTAGSMTLPYELKDPTVPHITVERWTETNGGITLPIMQNTFIDAIRIHDRSGNPVNHELLLGDTGEYYLDLKNKKSEPVYISYDLLPTQQPIVRAVSPIEIYIPFSPNKVPRELRQAAKAGPERVAGYTASHYLYTDSKPVLNGLVSGSRADEITSEVDHKKECNCYVCSTTAAIAEASIHDNKPLAVTIGYHLGGGNYLTSGIAHSWLTDESGKIIIDATPPGFINVPQENQNNLDAAWQKLIPPKPEEPMRFPDPKIPLALLGATGLLLLEARKKNILRGLRWRNEMIGGLAATRNLSPVDTHRLLLWSAYGGPNSPQPRFMGDESPITPSGLDWSNVPNETLRQAAKKGLQDAQLTRRQKSSVQKTAKHVLKYGKNARR